jgi:hypothetical protein
VSGNPHDTVAVVDDNGDEIATFPHDFAIHEVVLQLLTTPEAKGLKAVPRTPVSNGKASRTLIEPDHGDSMPGGEQIRLEPLRHLDRHHTSCLGHANLTRNRQLIAK